MKILGYSEMFSFGNKTKMICFVKSHIIIDMQYHWMSLIIYKTLNCSTLMTSKKLFFLNYMHAVTICAWYWYKLVIHNSIQAVWHIYFFYTTLSNEFPGYAMYTFNAP